MSYLRKLGRQVRSGNLGGGGWAVGNLSAPAVGSFRGADAAMQVAAFWACVRIIADSASLNPLYTYTLTQGVKTRQPDPFIDNQPFIGKETWDGIHQTVYSLVIHGNAYWYVVRDADYKPTGIYVLDPQMVKQRRLTNGLIVAAVNGQDFLVGDEIIHIPLMSVPGQLEGLSPIEYWSGTIDTARSVDDFGRAFFKNGSTTSGVLETAEQLTDDEARRLAAQWRSTHAGIGRAWLPAVLPANVQWKPTTVPNDQAQLLQTRQYARAEIAMMCGVPPHMIGDVDKTTSWGTGIEQQTMGFLRWTMRGYTTRIEAALSRLLPQPTFARFDLDDMLRTDTAGRYAAYQIARNIGAMTINEIRRRENLPPVDEFGDDPLVPLNSSINGMTIAEEPDAPPGLTQPPAVGSPTP